MNKKFMKLYQIMEQKNLEALLVTDKINWHYLCGFTGSTGLLLVMPEKNKLIIDGRYSEQATKQVQDVEIYTLKEKETHWQVAAQFLVEVDRIGFEQASLNYSAFLDLKGTIMNATKLIPTQNLVERLRMIKTTDELAKIRKAAQLADQTFTEILKSIKPGMTELELANEIDYFSKKIGSTGPAFETIVASGVRTALPHAHASDKIIKKNELIMIDFGCIYESYYSDITRTFSLGTVSEGIKDSYQLLLAAQQAALNSVRVGTKLSDIDRSARDCLKKEKTSQYFAHGLGHGIGLSCHEYPYLNQSSESILQPKMVFTVEPGVYYEGRYGIRIEDDVYVDEQGEMEILTKSKKEWMSVSWN